MRKLRLLPEGPSYAVEDGNEVIRTELAGGLARYRRDFIGSSSMVSATFVCMPDQARYLRAFYNTATGKAALPFLCDLIVDEFSDYTEHKCYFIPGSMKLTGNQGLRYVYSVMMEIKPITPNADFDNAYMDLYEAYGDDLSALLFGLDKLTNITMPNNIGPS